MLKVRSSIDSDGTKNFTKVHRLKNISLPYKKLAEQKYREEGVWSTLNPKLI